MSFVLYSNNKVHDLGDPFQLLHTLGVVDEYEQNGGPRVNLLLGLVDYAEQKMPDGLVAELSQQAQQFYEEHESRLEEPDREVLRSLVGIGKSL